MIFYKMNGLGNDYIFVDTTMQRVGDPSALAVRLADRHTSVGSDGLVLLSPSNVSDMKMEIFNRDGSRAEMCGNAIRCVVKYLHDVLNLYQEVYTISTDSGVRAVTIEENNDLSLRSAEVEMGIPRFLRSVTVSALGTDYRLDRVSIGNPHAVTFLRELPEDISEIGKIISEDKAFPSGANVEFARIENRRTIEVKVYERGTGVTLACGTGATAAAFDAIRLGRCDSPVKVVLPGGELTIRTEKEHYYMKGDANFNFKGEIAGE